MNRDDLASGWQHALASAVEAPTLPAPPGLALPASGSLDARLAIYRNNALVPLVQALEETLPACRRLLGGSLLRRLLLRFVRLRPPVNPVLQDYGADLPAFLAAAPECGRHPAAADLAALELEVVASWHAADAPLLQPADFARLQADPERLAGCRFGWHPAARLLASRHPVGTLWLQAHQERAWPGEATAAGAEQILVTRDEWSVQVRLLAPAQAALVQALRAGEALGAALAAALAVDAEADAVTLLAALVDGGFATPADAPSPAGTDAGGLSAEPAPVRAPGRP